MCTVLSIRRRVLSVPHEKSFFPSFIVWDMLVCSRTLYNVKPSSDSNGGKEIKVEGVEAFQVRKKRP